jgi:putative spermidine/putrescine transport system permease protein
VSHAVPGRPDREATPRGWLPLAPSLLVLTLLFFLPLALMVAISLRSAYPGPGRPTLEHYARLVGDDYFLRITLQTVRLALVVTGACLAVGYPVAYYLARTASRHKHLVFIAIVSPLLVSVVVRTLGWIMLLGSEGVVNGLLTRLGLVSRPLDLMYSFTTIVVGLVHVFLPFMVLSITSVLSGIDRALEESAEVLGAGRWRAFWWVTLPLSLRGVVTGCVLVFSMTLGAYVTPFVLGGGKLHFLATLIYDRMLVTVEWPLGATMAVLLLAVTVALLAASAVAGRRLATERR